MDEILVDARMALEIQVETIGRTVVVKLKGKFFLGNVRQVETIWEEQIKKEPAVIAIDCKHLEFIDSSAIGTLVKFLNSTLKENIQLVFVDLSNVIVSLFNRAKLNKVFKIINRDTFEKEFLRSTK